MLRVCAAGEFLGSLVQIEEGLRKLNINEEVYATSMVFCREQKYPSGPVWLSPYAVLMLVDLVSSIGALGRATVSTAGCAEG